MKLENVVDIYPLSPMQAGMLFHSLYAPESGVYFNQVSVQFVGEIDLVRFQQAWQRVVERHTILRTGFVWDDVEKPLQIVYRQAPFPWDMQDWRHWDAATQATQAAELLQAERRRGFDLHHPPLRWTWLRLSEQRYQFIWHWHHLLFDGWSLPILFEEVFSLYTQPAKRLPTTYPYRDYIAWLQQQDIQKAEAFWRTQLAGFHTPTPLVVDQRQRAIENENTPNPKATHRLQLPVLLTRQLNDFARHYRLTLNTLLQGAWALLLGRYSGAEEVLFGVTVSGRPTVLRGMATRVGLFINTLPLRVVLPSEGTLLPWLQQLQTQQMTQDEYAYTPLVEIQRWSETPAHSQLFESILVFENYPLEAERLQQTNNLRIEAFGIIEQTNYPLTVVVSPGDALNVLLKYDTDRFDTATIERMAGHLQTLLEGIVANPTQRLRELPLLTTAERQQLLVEWNDTQVDYPQAQCIHQLFETQVERTPDALAVVMAEEHRLAIGDWRLTHDEALLSNLQSLTYAELNARANQLAHHLIALGVQPDTLVAVMMDRSLEMVVSLLAVLKASGAYVPIDPTYPSERIAFTLQDCGAQLCLTEAALAHDLPVYEGHYLFVTQGSFDHYPTSNPIVAIQPHHLAYVIYTSGSTGQPKGVMISHLNLFNLLQWSQATLQLTATDRMLARTSLSFDVATRELFLPFIGGASLVLVTSEQQRDLPQLVMLMNHHQVSVAHFTPTLWAAMMDVIEKSDEIPKLRILMSGGEALTPELANRISHYFSGALFNGYGPTETTISVGLQRIVRDTASIAMAPPAPNNSFYILNEALQPVPLNAPGELCIGGLQLARGYLNRPELTAERFIANPFGEGRLYKTGDLARWLPDGTVEYLGRLDQQVKLRGFRIELGEIEAVLSQHPAVHEAVVLAREDTPGEKRLVAYVVSHDTLSQGQADTRMDDSAFIPSASHSVIVSALRSHLHSKLPEYMVPSAFVLLAALPLTPNGKLDRKALPAPDASSFATKSAYTPPSTPTEVTLAAIWSAVLGLEQVSIHDSFFELGGHSLLATQVVSRIRQSFAVELPLRTLFKYPTIEELGKRIQINEAIQRMAQAQSMQHQLDTTKVEEEW